MIEKFIPKFKKSSNAKILIELNQYRKPGENFINEFGEESKAKIIAYVSPNALTLINRKGILEFYEINGTYFEAPISITILKPKIFEDIENIEESIVKEIKEKLQKRVGKLEWGKIKALRNLFIDVSSKTGIGWTDLPFSYVVKGKKYNLWLERMPSYGNSAKWVMGVDKADLTICGSIGIDVTCLFEPEVSLAKFQEALSEIIDRFRNLELQIPYNFDSTKGTTHNEFLEEKIIKPVLSKYCKEGE
jgi:hypothetical protein